MNSKIIKINSIKLYMFMLAIIVVTRSISGKIFPSVSFENVLIIIVTVLPFFVMRQKIKFLDILWAITAVIILIHHDSSYPQIYITIYICALLSRILLKRQVFATEILLKILVVFSVITSIITWISVIAKPIYINFIIPLFNESGRQEILKELNFGKLSGLTDHYSRNAYYVVAGIIAIVSDIWSKQDTLDRNVKRRKWYLVLFEIVTLFAIGKRGHTIFLLITLYAGYMLVQNTFSKKVINTFRAIIMGLIVAALIFKFVPASQHIIERFVLESESDDLSNGRFDNYAMAFKLFKSHPIWGIGYGGFRGATIRGLTEYIYAGVHNDYLQFLCETGIVGFVFFIGLGIQSFISSIISLRKIVKRKMHIDTRITKLAIWTLMFQLFVLLYSITGLPHFDFEINTVYLVACSVSAILSNQIKKYIVSGENI